MLQASSLGAVFTRHRQATFRVEGEGYIGDYRDKRKVNEMEESVTQNPKWEENRPEGRKHVDKY